jgi:sulfonate transport system substrate-binding protein
MYDTTNVLLDLMGYQLALLACGRQSRQPGTVKLDWATYNPVGLVMREKGFLEQDLAKDGVKVEWVQSLGSNKALELLNSGSIDFGSTAGAAALIGKANGNPIKSVYVYSKPEWTALVVARDSPITRIEDLKGRKVADGRNALEKGDVAAWAGLDPLLAQTELDHGSRLFYRDPGKNTYGVLNVREAFAAQYPAYVRRVLAAYEKARLWAIQNPGEYGRILARDARLSDAACSGRSCASGRRSEPPWSW